MFALTAGLKRVPKLRQPVLGFSWVSRKSGGADEPFKSDIGARLERRVAISLFVSTSRLKSLVTSNRADESYLNRQARSMRRDHRRPPDALTGRVRT